MASIATALVAVVALNAWKRQDRAKRQAEFLDALVEATHAYIAEMPAPVSMLKMSMAGFKGYVPTDGDDRELRGAIAYIEKNGREDAKQLMELLDKVSVSAVKLDALATKGQVFLLEGYPECRDAVARLTLQLRRIQHFAIMLRGSWYWQNPEVRKGLVTVMEVSGDIEQQMTNNNIVVLEFARRTYARLYGTK